METRPFPELSSILGSSSSSKVLVVSLGLGCIKEFVMWEVNKMLGVAGTQQPFLGTWDRAAARRLSCALGGGCRYLGSGWV